MTRLHLLILVGMIFNINAHGQHGNQNQPPTHGGQQPQHVGRKMEDYVHDMEYVLTFMTQT